MMGASYELSEQALAVLALAWIGLTDRAIADRLTWSEGNVAYHLGEAMRVLGAQNRTHACNLALQRGYDLGSLSDSQHT